MPIYKARLNRDAGGSWVASSVELPNCWSRAATREEALAKLRDEIRYRIEYCPCSGVDDEFVRVELQVAREFGGGAEPVHADPAPAAPPPHPPASPPGAEVWAASRPAEPALLSGVAGCPAPSHAPDRTQAPAAKEPEHASVMRAPGWRRWDD